MEEEIKKIPLLLDELKKANEEREEMKQTIKVLNDKVEGLINFLRNIKFTVVNSIDGARG